MDISIDNIDLDDVPGYTPVTKSTPIWKRDMIEKKNQEKIEEYIAKKRREKEESEKWKHVPAWKRKLMMEKSKEKEQKTKEEIEKEKLDEEERRARIKEHQEMEKKMAEEMQEVPAWKREIMMKRGGAIRNWADEREEQNEQEMEEGQGEMESPDDAPSPTKTQSEPKHSPSKPPSNALHDTHDEPPPKPAQIQTKKVSPQKTSVISQNQTKEPEVKKSSPRKSLDESKIEEEWESLPLWKREIMMKRGGAPSNWGDEREEVNETEESVEQ